MINVHNLSHFILFTIVTRHKTFKFGHQKNKKRLKKSKLITHIYCRLGIYSEVDTKRLRFGHKRHIAERTIKLSYLNGS